MRIGKLKAHALALFLSDTNLRQVTAYIDEKTVFRLTRRTYRNKAGKRTSNKYITEGVISLTRPNYLERKFIKQLKAAGEPFPVKKVQLKFVKKAA